MQPRQQMTTHTGEKPSNCNYKFEECGYKCNLESELIKHMRGSVQKGRIRQKCKNEIFISLGGDECHLIHGQVGKVIRSPYQYIFGGRVVAVRCSP